MKYFKGDELELLVFETLNSVLEDLELEKDEFYDECYESYALGGAIYDARKSPLTNSIERDVFVLFFNELFQYFVEVGTVNAYIGVFEKIFGEDVEIVFTIPEAGHLNIDINASEVELSDWIIREIEGVYVYKEVIDDEGDNIALQSVVGLQSQYEVEQMLYEMVPQGVYTQITLTIGE